MDEIHSFLLSVIESSGDAIAGLRLDGRIISWNPAAEHIYGFTHNEIVGKNISDIALPDRQDEIALILSRISNGERVSHFQTIHLNREKKPFLVSLSISPVYDVKDQVVGASFIARSLNEKIQFEKTIQETEGRYQKLKASLELAQQIQETLLPKEMSTNEFDVYAKTLYSEEIGGDYYDYFMIPLSNDEQFGVALGDVTGHGTAAALLMALAKGALQSEVKNSPFSLEIIMSRLNQLFYECSIDDHFMTLFLGTLEGKSQTLTWCSAGQGPVYVYHSKRQYFQELSCTGSPLGILYNEKYQSVSTTMSPGDILIVGTDGLWEAKNPQGEMFTVDRFRQTLATWHNKSAKEICEIMLNRVKNFSKISKLDDDASLLIVKIPERLELTA